MSLTAYQINNGMPTPIADRKMYDLTSGGVTGVIEGCSCSKYAASVIVNDGWIIIQGCIIRVKRETVPVTLSSSGTLNGRLSIKLDVSEPSIEWYSEAASTLPTIPSTNYPQEDINGSGNVYILPLCTYQVNGTQISSTEVTNIAPQVSISSVAQIATSVASLSTTVSSLSTSVTSLSTSLNSLSTTVGSLSTRVTNLSSSAVTDVAYSNGTITRTKNGASGNVVTAATLKGAMKGLVLYNSTTVNKTLNMTLSNSTLTITFS